MNREAFAPGEWYHCYSRGVDKRKTFEIAADYERFRQLLYLSNSKDLVHRSETFSRPLSAIYSVDRKDPLVTIGAYCLMPNHFHLLLREESDSGGGISKFMQRIGTAYAMYFNAREDRIGNLFVKPFRSKHVHDDRYLKRVTQYIHFNPVELIQPEWKQGKVGSMTALEKDLRSYEYSSLLDFEEPGSRLESSLLLPSVMSLLRDEHLSLKDALSEMREYYAELYR